MAPTSTAPLGAPTSADFDGDDFSNNLFSDLAPLLTLFGEQVTKQFLSMSLGWADHILLAMGPLGIITIVVSAIRVSGPKKFKAIIGRAHESLTAAEMELLSSTSHNVCELWDGNQIVRTIGRPEGMKELIIVQEEDEHERQQSGYLQVLDLPEAVRREYLRDWGKPRKDPKDLLEQAPNITLNVNYATLSRAQLWFWAAVGLALQTAALILPGLTVYLWKWQKGGEDIAAYGYPCFLSGTLAIILGIIGCSCVIERRTEETTYYPTGRPISHIVRVQKAGTVGDQHVQSYAIMNQLWNFKLRTSRLKPERGDSWSLIAALSTLITISGYIVQFVGLRSLHWSATIIQLGVTLAMTCFRALVRRGLTNTPVCLPLTKRHEISSLALALTSDHAKSRLRKRRFNFVQSWALYSRHQGSNWNATDLPKITTGPFTSNKVVSLHTSLSKSLQQPSETCKWTKRVCAAVEGIMKYLTSTKNISLKEEGALSTGYLAWTVTIIRRHLDNISSDGDDKFSDLTVGVALQPIADKKDRLKSTILWKADEVEINSILDLCVLSIASTTQENSECLLPSGVFRGLSGYEILQKGSYSRILGQVRLDDDRSNTLGNWIDFQNFFLAPQEKFRLSEAPHVPQDVQSRDTPPDDFEPENALPYFPIHLQDCGPREVVSLELLNLFLLAISSQISRINGSTQINMDVRSQADKRAPDRKDALQPQWTNTAINELSSCIVEAGLVKSLDEANTFVIPALYQYDLLPKEQYPTTADSSPGQPEASSDTVDGEPSGGSRSTVPDHDEKANTPTSQASPTA